MKVLVACEESQRVCIEFRKLGHEAYSCDIEPCSGGHEEWHIQSDVIPLINGNCSFCTVDGTEHRIVGKWDMIIAHPPCTYLTVVGNRWFDVEKYGDKAIEREKKREQGKCFFMRFVNANCDKIAIENPIGIMSTVYRKPDCIIQPWQFGHNASKSTCLWLKNLDVLKPTDIIKDERMRKENQQISADGKLLGFMTKGSDGKFLRYNDPETAKIRSKTFPGIAKAMAEQWGGDINNMLIIPGQLFKLGENKYLYIARRKDERLCFDCGKREYKILRKEELEKGEIIKFMEKDTWVLIKFKFYFKAMHIKEYLHNFSNYKNKKNIYAVFKAKTKEEAEQYKKYWLDDNRNKTNVIGNEVK